MCILFVIFKPNFPVDSTNSNVHFFFAFGTRCCEQLRWHMQMNECSTCFLRKRRSCQSFRSTLKRVRVKSTSSLFLFKFAYSWTKSLQSNENVWSFSVILAKPEKEKHGSELNYNILELKMTDKLLFCFYWGFCKASPSQLMRTVRSARNSARRS